MIRCAKWAIWLYIILLIFEGSLRKWIMPGLSQPLLIVRDPVLLLIYGLALMGGIVPRTRFLLFLAAIALASFCFAFLAGQNNLWVTLYGIRSNYLHVPLIWVMAEVMNREDVEKVGVFFLIIAIAMTILMIMQFKAPIASWINRGVGDEEGGQIYGAGGHIRPPGFFTFITGPMVFFPFAAAFFLNAINRKEQKWWRMPVLIISGLAIAIALPISISRGVMIGTLFVLAVYLIGLFKVGIFNLSFLRFGALGLLLLVALSFFPIFKEAREAFMDRWDTAAAESEGDAVGSLVSRVTLAFTQPIDTIERTPTFGYGVGVGTNVGARLLAGSTGFLLAEDEWGRVIMELGPMLGLSFILFRICLTCYLGVIAFRALRDDDDLLPLLIFSAAAWVILMTQWGQATQLGFAVIGGGLLLASVNRETEDDEEENSDDSDDETDDDEDDSDEEDEPSPRISEHEARRRRMRGL